MNYNHLIYFSVLARLEHYGKAAEELGISQPSLSNAISKLEKELGVYLFEKQGRNVKLTYYGKQYQEYVDKGLNTLNQGHSLMAHCADREHGIIRIGAVSSAGPGRVLTIMSRFVAIHPDIRFSYVDGTSLTLLEELKEEKHDMVISARDTADPQLNYYPLWEQRFVVIVPPGHPLEQHTAVTLAEISPFPMIRYHESAAARALIDSLFAEAGIAQITRCEVSDDFHIAGMVAAGMGIAIMVDSSMPQLYGLMKIPLKDIHISRNLYLSTRKNSYISESAQEFVQTLRKEYIDLP